MAQIVILILLIVLAFFLIRGFARGDLLEGKKVYGSEMNDFLVVMDKWKEISISSLTHTENINDDNYALARNI
jgi:hypothetical protein